jgi:hypothetical protein
MRSSRLTTWCEVLLQKLIVSQLVNKFPVFNGTRRFVNVFTWDSPGPHRGSDESNGHPHYRVPLRSILILSSFLRLGIANCFFLSGFGTKMLYTFIYPHACYIPHPSLYSFHLFLLLSLFQVFIYCAQGPAVLKHENFVTRNGFKDL